MKHNSRYSSCFPNSLKKIKRQALSKGLAELYCPIKKRASNNSSFHDYDDYKEDKYDSYDSSENRKRKYTKSNDTEDNNEKDDPKPITCPICYDDVKIAYVTKCNHNFCYGCVDNLISRSTNNEWACPICRKICKT